MDSEVPLGGGAPSEVVCVTVTGPPGPVVCNGGVVPGETEEAEKSVVVDEEEGDTDCATLDAVEGVGPTMLVTPLIKEGINPGTVVVLGVGEGDGGVVEVVEVRGVLDPIGRIVIWRRTRGLAIASGRGRGKKKRVWFTRGRGRGVGIGTREKKK